MRFVCLGYIDEKTLRKLKDSEGQRMVEACLAYDDELRQGGHFKGGEALDSGAASVTLRIKNGNVEVTDGPFSETKEMLGGIMLLEARDLNHAIALISRHPGLSFGPFEIRPSNESINQLITRSDAAFRQQQLNEQEAEVRRTLEKWAESTRLDEKDKILQGHDRDALIFDVLAPLKYDGTEAYRSGWGEWQPENVGEVVFELHELKITLGDQMAFATSLVHCAGSTVGGGSYNDTVRATFCLKKVDGCWRIVHQHISMPLPRPV